MSVPEIVMRTERVWHCAITSPPPIGEFKLCRWVTTVCGNRQVSYGEGARRADGMWGRSSRVETIPPEQWQDLPAGPSASLERWESQAASEWRDLDHDEPPQIDDQYQNEDGQWCLVYHRNLSLFTPHNRHNFRRRIPAQVASGNETKENTDGMAVSPVVAASDNCDPCVEPSRSAEVAGGLAPAASGGSAVESVTSETEPMTAEETRAISDYHIRKEPQLRQATSGGGELTPHAWGVVLELHDAAREAIQFGAQHDRLDKAIAAAERLLTQPRPAVPASGGGEGGPVAWGVMSSADPPHRVGLHWDQELAERWARQKQSDYTTQLTVFPLYRQHPQPRGWLTEEERKCIEGVRTLLTGMSAAKDPEKVLLESWVLKAERDRIVSSFDDLLARSSPPEVVKPQGLGGPKLDQETTIQRRDRQWTKAITTAGVAVKEVG